MDELAPGIFAIAGLKMGRSYLVEGGDGIALVDTSSSSASGRIIAAIAAAGHHVEDLRAIVATHYHYDHTGNAGTLIDRSGAELCLHEDDAPYVEGRVPWKGSNRPFGFLNRFAPAPFSLKVTIGGAREKGKK